MAGTTNWDQNTNKFDNVLTTTNFTATTPSGSIVFSSTANPSITGTVDIENMSISGNLTVAGTATFNKIIAVTSSYSSGSTIFGDALADTHQFTGSVFITGSSFNWNNSRVIASNVTSSMSVASASQALTASYASQALTASYASQALTASYASQALTASYAINSSYKIITDTTSGSSSNSTSEILLKSLLIPANTFPANSVLTIQWLLSKTGTNDIIYHYLKANTSATLVGATQLAIRSVAAAQRYIPNYRRLAIRVANGTGNGSLIYDPTVGSATSDLNENASPPVTVSIDWTNNVYLIISGYVVSASDSIQVEYLTINN